MADNVYNELISEGFERVERDDRLLDVFPKEVREKGIQLWDRWNADTVEIVRVYTQGKKKNTKHTLNRTSVETLLRRYKKSEL